LAAPTWFDRDAVSGLDVRGDFTEAEGDVRLTLLNPGVVDEGLQVAEGRR